MNYRTTLLLAAALLLVAVAVYTFWDRLTGEAPPPVAPKDTFALVEDLSVSDAASATLLKRDAAGELKTKLAFKRSEDTWRVTEPVDWPADDYEVTRLVRAAIEGKYRHTLEPGADGQPTLEDLDLDPPLFRLTVAAQASDEGPGKTITLDIGRKSPIGNGLYVRLRDADRVMILEEATLLARARDKVSAYRDRNLVGLARDEVVRIDLDGETGRARLDRGEGDRWVLSAPFAARADKTAVSGILYDGLNMPVKEFIDDAPKDLGRYGLAEPRLTITVWKKGPEPEAPEKPEPGEEKSDDEAAEETKPTPTPEPVKAMTLRFGSWADLKRETVHVTADDGRHVVSVSADKFKGLSKSPDDLRDRRVVDLDKGRAVRISLKNARGEFELAKTEGKWRLRVPDRPETDADSEAVDDLLDEIADLKAMYFLDEDQRPDPSKPFADGHVRIQIEGEAGPRGLEISGKPGSRILVRNIREDWIGRLNEQDLKWPAKNWLAHLDRKVLTFDPDRAARLSIRTPDRTLVFEKKDDAWKLTQPIEAEPESRFVENLLEKLSGLSCESFVAATDDFAKYALERGQVVCTVSLPPQEEGGSGAERTLHLARQSDGRILARATGSRPATRDLVFEVQGSLLDRLAGEPLPKDLTDLDADKITALEVLGGDAPIRLIKWEKQWYYADEAGNPDKRVEGDAAETLASEAASLRAWRWADYEAKDLVPFGLDRPAVRVRIQSPDSAETILVSAKNVAPSVAGLSDRRPLRYAMLEGSKRVAILAGNAGKILLEAPKTLTPEAKGEK